MATSHTRITDQTASGWVLAHSYSDGASVDVQSTKGPDLEVFANTSGTNKPADNAEGKRVVTGALPLSVTLGSTEFLWARVWQGYDDTDESHLIKDS